MPENCSPDPGLVIHLCNSHITFACDQLNDLTRTCAQDCGQRLHIQYVDLALSLNMKVCFTLKASMEHLISNPQVTELRVSDPLQELFYKIRLSVSAARRDVFIL